jgi:formamidopyrimidine-DNA glycosylase
MNLEQQVKHFRKCAEVHRKEGSPCRAAMYECDAEIAELKIKIRELQDEKRLQAEIAGYE